LTVSHTASVGAAAAGAPGAARRGCGALVTQITFAIFTKSP
jgi:hypothetical protein